MTDQIEELKEQFDRADQEPKRKLGMYLAARPARWVPRQDLVDHLKIDESGVTRHVDTLHDEGYLVSKREEGKRYLMWNGRGVGGFGYWMRQAIPSHFWAAGRELRPLFTLDSLGGAYVPTLLFGTLSLIGFLTAIFTVILSYLPMDSIFGITVTDAFILTGLATIMASVLFVLVPFTRLLEQWLESMWNWWLTATKRSGRD